MGNWLKYNSLLEHIVVLGAFDSIFTKEEIRNQMIQIWLIWIADLPDGILQEGAEFKIV